MYVLKLHVLPRVFLNRPNKVDDRQFVFCLRGFVVVFKAAAVHSFKDARKKNERTLEVILERQPGRLYKGIPSRCWESVLRHLLTALVARQVLSAAPLQKDDEPAGAH